MEGNANQMSLQEKRSRLEAKLEVVCKELAKFDVSLSKRSFVEIVFKGSCACLTR